MLRFARCVYGEGKEPFSPPLTSHRFWKSFRSIPHTWPDTVVILEMSSGTSLAKSLGCFGGDRDAVSLHSRDLALSVPFDPVSSTDNLTFFAFLPKQRSQCNVCSWSLSFCNSFLRLKLKEGKCSSGLLQGTSLKLVVPQKSGKDQKTGVLKCLVSLSCLSSEKCL